MTIKHTKKHKVTKKVKPAKGLNRLVKEATDKYRVSKTIADTYEISAGADRRREVRVRSGAGVKTLNGNTVAKRRTTKKPASKFGKTKK